MTDQPAESTANHAAWRTALRREKLAARQALPMDAHLLASRKVLDNLAILFQALPAGTVAFCWPVRAEIDCQPLVENLLVAGWQACMPVVVSTGAPMVFRPWTPTAPMTADPHGIPVPDGTAIVVPGVILLPLVAFDSHGYRLGYGGGYFDRTLASLGPQPLTIGVGFDLGAVASIFPAAHDIPLDWVVTESGARRPARADF